MVQKLELLAPAGNLETVKAVINAGADAVYFGGSLFSARAYAGNLNQKEILYAIDYGHIHEKKMMLAVNTLLKEKELEDQLYEYLLPYYEQGLDAVIVQDFGVMQFIRRNFKGLPIHTSTQMTVAGVEGARFLAQAGAERIVMARELSLAEIQKIHKEVPVELESFVHGALCYCYSGQCLLSSMLGGRSGNRGRCAQPCRLPYDSYDKDLKKINDRQHCYPLSPKDLCTIEMIPQLAESGIYSFKIEGRMKQTEYAKGVVSVYRKYMDMYLNYGEKDYYAAEEDKKKLFDFGNRSGFTEGYYQQWNGPDMVTFCKPGHEKGKEPSESPQIEEKEKILGCMRVKKDMPAEFTAVFRDVEATVTGAIPEKAQKQPITEEVLRSKLIKTGNTPFVFETLTIQLDSGLFLSMASVNEMRRQALEQLEEQYLSRYRRTTESGSHIHAPKKREKTPIPKQMFLSASAETKEQIYALLDCPFISRIYIDSGALQREHVIEKLKEISKKTKETGKQVYYILPAVFRNHTAAFYQTILPKLKADGFLVKSYDALGFLLGQDVDPFRIQIDHNLYTWSTESQKAFFDLGIGGDTLPYELNKKEIRNRKNDQSEMQIYGYQPLMTSVQCIQKNLAGCRHTPDVFYLKDRYGIFFPVKNYCQECYNVIYNSRPLQLFSAVSELMSYGIAAFRLSFTVESKEQVGQILKVYEKQLPFDVGEYTYGHYKRGVE